ncbi:hypothetical protein [Nonomuraea sp. NPDC050783]|uniref:hypothetical protein n=1 Tax=Nonomuraea sp. NPDC050783 TaxID=3154634 RepID=UPI0034652A45
MFYGPYTRRFYAIAAWSSPHPLVLDADGVGELRELMREAHVELGLTQGPRAA